MYVQIELFSKTHETNRKKTVISHKTKRKIRVRTHTKYENKMRTGN